MIELQAGRLRCAGEPELGGCVSHVNNAVQTAASGSAAADLGLATLQPGETMMAQMTIGVEAVR